MRNSTAQERFGELAASFGVLLPAGRRYRRPLGLSLAEQYVIEQLLYYHRQAGVWASISQSVLAEELGISRTTVNGDLQRLKRSGLVATRRDPSFGSPASTLRYSLDPYLAVLAMWEGHDCFDPEVWTEGNERLLRFAHAVNWGAWVWAVDGFGAPQFPVADVLMRFRTKYDSSDRLSAPPTTIAVTVRQFLSEERAPASVGAKQGLTAPSTEVAVGSDVDPSVPPTEVESHIRTSVHELKALLPKELETLVHEQLKTSELKTLDNQLVTLVVEQPETSIDHREQGDLVVEEEVSDWISEQ